MDGVVAAALAAGLPAGLYAAAHPSSLWHPTHMWSVLLLASAPVLFVACLKARALAPNPKPWRWKKPVVSVGAPATKSVARTMHKHAAAAGAACAFSGLSTACYTLDTASVTVLTMAPSPQARP